MIWEWYKFIPYHMNASLEDLCGNNGINRYIFLCGSNERAKKRIGSHFNHLVIREHPRQHNLYLGSIKHKDKNIDVASISTGIGCPSADNIINELYALGGRRFLRVAPQAHYNPIILKQVLLSLPQQQCGMKIHQLVIFT